MLVQHLGAFLLAATLLIVVPGPATLFVASHARRSIAAAVGAGLGIVSGDVLMMSLSGAGFAAVVSRWPALIALLSTGGALYLAYLGVGLLRAQPSASPPSTGTHGYLRGVLITLTNPKPILFFATFFPAFIPPATPSRIASFAVLGAAFEAISVVYLAALITLVAHLGRATSGGRAAWVRRISGAGLLIVSAMLLARALA